MLSKKQQQHYFEKRIKNILRHLKLFCRTRSAEELHQLRVEIKRVNALVHFSDGCCKKQNMVSYLKPLSAIFKHAARIRNAHINLELTQGVANKIFRTEQNKLQMQEWQKFTERYKSYKAEIKAVRKKMQSEFTAVKNKEVAGWYKKELKKTAAHLTTVQEELHLGRKRIKRMLYMNELRASQPALNEPYLKQLENAIGKWHDIQSTVKVLKRKHALNKKLNAQLSLKQSELKFYIHQSSPNFLKQVYAL